MGYQSAQTALESGLSSKSCIKPPIHGFSYKLAAGVVCGDRGEDRVTVVLRHEREHYLGERKVYLFQVVDLFVLRERERSKGEEDISSNSLSE